MNKEYRIIDKNTQVLAIGGVYLMPEKLANGNWAWVVTDLSTPDDINAINIKNNKFLSINGSNQSKYISHLSTNEELNISLMFYTKDEYFHSEYILYITDIEPIYQKYLKMIDDDEILYCYSDDVENNEPLLLFLTENYNFEKPY